MGEQHQGFGDRLASAIGLTSPLCAGIDPSSALLGQWGLTDDAAGLATMARTVVAASAGVAAAIKPQVAFFERFGSAGYAVLEEVIALASDAGLLVVIDAKRGDIGTTMEAYGEAWLDDRSSLAADALTVTSYLGIDAMEPVFDLARASGRGLFVVVASSNPEGRALQEAKISPTMSIEQSLLADLGRRNRAEIASTQCAFGSLGAVVGATRSAGQLDLASLAGPYLVPGVGAQGATPEDVATLFAHCSPRSVLVNASRSILSAGPDEGAVRAAAESLATELTRAL
ncbi:MAG: orotidine-5'-phosphate decarboxylase [Actinomycetes bacterium]